MADNDSVQGPVRVSRTYGRAAPAEPVLEDAPVVLTTLKPRMRPAPVHDPEDEEVPFDNGLGALSDWRTRLLQSDSEDDEDASVSKRPPGADKASNQARAELSPPATSAATASTITGVVASSPADDSNVEQPSFDSSMNISMSSSRSANAALTTPSTSPGDSPVHLPPHALGKPLLLRDTTPDEDRPFAARATQQANKTARVKQAASASSLPKPTKLKKPTKKEAEETKRETARILSDQRVHLPRPEKESKLSLTDLAAKLSNKWSQKSKASTVPPAPSSPIDRFSSSSAIDEHDSGPSAPRGSTSKHAPRVLDKAALQDAAKPLFGRTAKKSTTVNSGDLNKTLLTRARHEAAAAREHKKQDWISRGGTLRTTEVDRARVQETPSQLSVNDEDEDAADGDWKPAGQDEADADADASGSERGGSPGVGSGDEDEDDGEAIPDTQPVDMEGGDTEEDEDEPVEHARLPRRIPLQRAARVIDSDSEEDDRPQSHILVPDTSFVLPPDVFGVHRASTLSDAVSASESEMGKENSEYRKYDDGDLKENSAPARLLVPGALLGGEDDKENPHQAQGSTNGPALLDTDAGLTDDSEQAVEAFEDKENQPTRRPLSVLSRRHSSYVTAGRAVSGPARGGQRSMQPLGELAHESDTDDDDGPHSPARAGKQMSRMTLGDDSFGDSSGLTQLFNDEPISPPRPLLGRSKTEFFPSRRLFSDTIDSQASISFTPTQRQRSRSRITESQRLKDDELLALDNEEPFSQAATSSVSKDEEWFVGEDGLMTQTRPTFTPIPASSQTLFGASLDPSPFGREFTSPGSLLESPIPANQPLRRLKRKSEAEEPEELIGNIPGLNEFFSPSRPAKKQRNAFEVLREAKPEKVKKERQQKSAIASEFVEDQANESDEEAGFGFGGRGDDETFDEEEMRAAVEGMTDDKAMDVDELAEDRIMEKHQEHLRADDEKIQALHERATRGDLRKKKRDGLQFDDDSSDDERKSKRPRPQKGARNIENDTLPDLAKHAETLAFYNAYHSSTADDEKIELQDATFGASSDVEDVDMDDEPGDDNENENEDGDSVAKAASSDDDDEGVRVVPARRRPTTQRQMQEDLREAARKKETFNLNVDDATWVDQDNDDDTDLEVEEVSVKVNARDARTSNFDRDVVAPKAQIATGQAAKLADWAKQENRRTGSSSARTGGKGSAVTGHPSRTASAAANGTTSGSNDRRRRASAPQGSKGTGLNKFLSAARSRA